MEGPSASRFTDIRQRGLSWRTTATSPSPSAHYREAVLQAFCDVADVLRGLEHNAHSLTATTAAAISARETLDLVQKRYAMGAANYLEVLTAQQVAEGIRMDLCAAQAQRLIDTVTFYSAMGGGWKDDDDKASRQDHTP